MDNMSVVLLCPFQPGRLVGWLRFINVSSTVVPCYRGNIFDHVDLDDTVITDIDVTIKGVVYVITYIRISDITRFKILE
jgi:hypothetical protein